MNKLVASTSSGRAGSEAGLGHEGATIVAMNPVLKIAPREPFQPIAT